MKKEIINAVNEIISTSIIPDVDKISIRLMDAINNMSCLKFLGRDSQKRFNFDASAVELSCERDLEDVLDAEELICNVVSMTKAMLAWHWKFFKTETF